MCLPFLGLAGAAGAAGGLSTAMSVIGTLTSVVGTAAGIAQSQQQAAFQQQQAAIQQQQASQQAANRNQELANQYVGEVAQRDANIKAYMDQNKYNMDALNKSSMEQQTKLDEARTKAAFKSQEIYAKSIGARGAVMASGRSGQTVGLLSMDVERQAGMQQAEQDAMVDSAARAAAVGTDVATTQYNSEQNKSWSQLGQNPMHPSFAQRPAGAPSIGTPTYNWF